MFHNKAITVMRAEISKGPDWMGELHWSVRLSDNPAEPVITADEPVVVEGRVPDLETALRDPRTRIFFPVAWQACLIGSRTRSEKEVDVFEASELRSVRSLYLRSSFAYSPVRVRP